MSYDFKRYSGTEGELSASDQAQIERNFKGSQEESMLKNYVAPTMAKTVSRMSKAEAELLAVKREMAEDDKADDRAFASIIKTNREQEGKLTQLTGMVQDASRSANAATSELKKDLARLALSSSTSLNASMAIGEETLRGVVASLTGALAGAGFSRDALSKLAARAKDGSLNGDDTAAFFAAAFKAVSAVAGHLADAKRETAITTDALSRKVAALFKNAAKTNRAISATQSSLNHLTAQLQVSGSVSSGDIRTDLQNYTYFDDNGRPWPLHLLLLFVALGSAWRDVPELGPEHKDVDALDAIIDPGNEVVVPLTVRVVQPATRTKRSTDIAVITTEGLQLEGGAVEKAAKVGEWPVGAHVLQMVPTRKAIDVTKLAPAIAAVAAVRYMPRSWMSASVLVLPALQKLVGMRAAALLAS